MSDMTENIKVEGPQDLTTTLVKIDLGSCPLYESSILNLMDAAANITPEISKSIDVALHEECIAFKYMLWEMWNGYKLPLTQVNPELDKKTSGLFCLTFVFAEVNVMVDYIPDEGQTIEDGQLTRQFKSVFALHDIATIKDEESLDENKLRKALSVFDDIDNIELLADSMEAWWDKEGHIPHRWPEGVAHHLRESVDRAHALTSIIYQQ